MRKAFTLVELLVVIGVLAVLTSLILPTLQRAKASAWKVNCYGNLRQIWISWELYTSDHEDYWPPHMQADRDNPLWPNYNNRFNVTWRDVVWDMYMERNTNVWECPANRLNHRKYLELYLDHAPSWKRNDLNQEWNYSYGLNARGMVPWRMGNNIHMGGLGAPGDLYDFSESNNDKRMNDIMTKSYRMSDIVAPSKMISVSERTPYGSSAAFSSRKPYTIRFNTPGSHWDNFGGASISRRHNQKLSIVFADGHVEIENLKKITNPTRENFSRWNFYNDAVYTEHELSQFKNSDNWPPKLRDEFLD